jgi:hypothetical protein
MIILYYNCNKKIEKFTEKYKLCIMAIFKNEEEYLEEWLEHHINQGVEHFYLYCNDEVDNLIKKYEYLSKYSKYITLILWNDKINNGSETIQRQAYTHCVTNYNKEYDFIMMLDIDKFLVHQEKDKKVITFIDSFGKNWENIKAIKVQRFDFGSDGHVEKPKGKIMDNYKKHENICSSYKTIANSNFIDLKKKFYGVHDFPFLNKKGKIYNDYFSYKYTGFPNSCKKETINEIPIVINHYYTKSYNEYIKRCKLWEKGGVNTIGYRKNCEELFHKRDIK